MAARRARAHGRIDSSPALTALAEILEGTEGAISFYWAIRTEIDPLAVMRDMEGRGRIVCLPVSRRNEALKFRQWTPKSEMETDAFGVETPTEEASQVVPSVLVVPLLAFDARLHRLGYGAGHYDRTLAELRRHGEALAIGFAYGAQEVDALPILPTDIALDLVVTEQGIRQSDKGSSEVSEPQGG